MSLLSMVRGKVIPEGQPHQTAVGVVAGGDLARAYPYGGLKVSLFPDTEPRYETGTADLVAECTNVRKVSLKSLEKRQ